MPPCLFLVPIPVPWGTVQLLQTEPEDVRPEANPAGPVEGTHGARPLPGAQGHVQLPGGSVHLGLPTGNQRRDHVMALGTKSGKIKISARRSVRCGGGGARAGVGAAGRPGLAQPSRRCHTRRLHRICASLWLSIREGSGGGARGWGGRNGVCHSSQTESRAPVRAWPPAASLGVWGPSTLESLLALEGAGRPGQVLCHSDTSHRRPTAAAAAGHSSTWHSRSLALALSPLAVCGQVSSADVTEKKNSRFLT